MCAIKLDLGCCVIKVILRKLHQELFKCSGSHKHVSHLLLLGNVFTRMR